MAVELKQLNFDDTSFVANGVTYYIKPSLSVERFKHYERLQLNFGYGRSFESIQGALTKIVDLFNKGKSVEAFSILHNLKESVNKDLDKRSHSAFLLCGLFISAEGEDLTEWTDELGEKKIKDWNLEGYDANSFFQVAANLVSGFITELEMLSQDTSEVQKVMDQLNDLMPKD